MSGSNKDARRKAQTGYISYADAPRQGEIVAQTLRRLEEEDFSREALAEVVELSCVLGQLTDEEAAEIQRVLAEGVKIPPDVSFVNRAKGKWEHCEPPPSLQERSWDSWRKAVYYDAKHQFFNNGVRRSTNALAQMASTSRRSIGRWRDQDVSKEYFEYYESQVVATIENERDYWNELIRVREERSKLVQK